MKNIQKIIKLYLKNKYDDETQKMFIQWYDLDLNSTEKEEVLKEYWMNTDSIPTDSTADSYKNFERKVTQYEKTRFKIKRVLNVFQKIAAIAIIPLLAFILVQFFQNDDSKTEWVECFVPYGNIRTISLPDSTHVTLNSGSFLLYPKEFNTKNRDVYLNGEACFEVARDEKRPFHVKTSDLKIEVLGTIFNVLAYPDSRVHKVTLKEGKVKLNTGREDTEDIILEANQQLSLNRETQILDHQTVFEVDNAFAWMNGHLILQNEKMSDIYSRIEKKYNVKVELQTNKYNDTYITIKLKNNETLSDFLHILNLILPDLKYTIEENKVLIQ